MFNCGNQPFQFGDPLLDGLVDTAVRNNRDVAAATARLRFTTFVLKAPVRPPVLLAKQAASVAVLTGNRLRLGLGLDDRLGETGMLAVVEDIDWLGEVAPFEIVEHGGQWWQLPAAVEQMRARAHELRKAGEKPPLVIVDTVLVPLT